MLMLTRHTHDRSRLALLALLVLGCNPNPTSNDAATENTTQPSSESSTGSDSESDSGSESETSDTPPDMGAETGDDEVVATDLQPLAIGSSWQYERTHLTLLGDNVPACGLGPATMSIAEMLDLDSRSAIRLNTVCNNNMFLSVDGDAIDWHDMDGMPRWRRHLENPVVENMEWTTHFDIVFRWTPQGAISVPAGDFDNCWRREVVGTMTYTVYCPGVGPVRTYAPEGFYDSVLVDYSLGN